MRVRNMMRPWVAVPIVAVVFAVLASSGVAYAGHQTSNVLSYTGCLSVTGGTLTLIAQGDSPQRQCPAGSEEAHFSGGDITQIVAGDGLSGGGDNGSVTISLQPGYALPQSCTSGQSVSWNGSGWSCADVTTYSAGTGLDLNGSQFSIAAPYQLPQTCTRGQAVRQNVNLLTGVRSWGCGTYVPASQNCPAGQFTNAVDGNGTLQCAAPSGSGGIGWVDNKQASYDSGAGIPDDDTFHTYASVNPSPGTYMLTAKGVIGSQENVADFQTVDCVIRSGTTVLDTMEFSSKTLNNVVQVPFSLTAFASVSASSPTVELACRASSGADGLNISYGRISGIKVS